MLRIMSCYSNSYGPRGVRPAVEGIARAGLSQVELALRGHDFGGLVIPESAVVTAATVPREVAASQALAVGSIRPGPCGDGR
jgi:hypothetical protein